MRIRVFLPTRVLFDEEAVRVVAEAENGLFCLLPRHVDFVAALIPGILVFSPVDGEERILAVDEGTLVKVGDEVLVSVRRAVPGRDLSSLRDVVQKQFLAIDEHERTARTALARLEAGIVRRFMELQEHSR